MAMTNPYFLILLPFLLLLVAFHRARKQPYNPPPGPPRLPILGNLHNLGSLPHVTSHLLSKKHGPLLSLSIGRTPALFVCDANAASQVLKSQDHVFCSRAQIASVKLFTYGGNDLAFSAFGDHWKRARRLCNAEVFNPRKVQSFESFRSQEVDLLVKTIQTTCCGEKVVNFSETMFCYVNNLLFREVFGERASSEGECGWSPFQGLLREVNGALSLVGVEDVFPLFGWVDRVSGFRRRIERVFERMDLLFEEKIGKKMRSRREGIRVDGEEDFLDALLNVRDKEEDNASLSMGTIKGILMVG